MRKVVSPKIAQWLEKRNLMINEVLTNAKRKQQRLVKELGVDTQRPYFEQIDIESRGNLLIGPRGTGKTTYLISQLAAIDNGLYLSLDDLQLLNEDLFELVEVAYDQGVRVLFLDEVHYYNNWSQLIKNLYDSFPKLKIILSDSSSLILRLATADLSRRFPKLSMPLLSFREYIYFRTKVLLPTFDPLKSIKGKNKIILPKEIEQFRLAKNINQLFLDFLDFGQRPFFVEKKYSERIENIIEKTIFSDIPYFLPSFQKNHLNGLRSIVAHLATSTIPTVNIQSLCNQWEIGKDKVYELLSVLEASGIIQIVYNTPSPKGSSKGDKIFFQDCSFYAALGGHHGNRREAFFVSALRFAKHVVLTSKDEEHGDYLVEQVLFEVGGKGKRIQKADIVIKETLDDIYAKEWPLWIFGFLW